MVALLCAYLPRIKVLSIKYMINAGLLELKVFRLSQYISYIYMCVCILTQELACNVFHLHISCIFLTSFILILQTENIFYLKVKLTSLFISLFLINVYVEIAHNSIFTLL